jgi:hypothetical protein
MSRRRNDPRVASVLAAFERMLDTPERETIDISDQFDKLLESLSTSGWSDDAMRAVLRAIVTHCPDGYLDLVHSWAQHEVDWTKEWEIRCRYQRLTGKELPIELDLPAVLRAVAGDGDAVSERPMTSTEAH